MTNHTDIESPLTPFRRTSDKFWNSVEVVCVIFLQLLFLRSNECI